MPLTRGLDVQGEQLTLLGHRLYVETSGDGPGTVVFEAGMGFGRTSWDPVVPLLQGAARVVTYDRMGHGRSEPGDGPTSIDEMAATLSAVVVAAASGPVVLVSHSLGCLIARQAAPALGSRLRGLVLLDPTPERAAMFDNVDRLTRQQGRVFGVFEFMSRVPPLRGLLASAGIGSYRQSFSAETWAAIRAEDLLPSSFAQMRREAEARAAAVSAFRSEPPRAPECPVILLSASRAARGGSGYLADIQEHQRQYAEALPNGRFELVDATHLVQADQPGLVVERIRELLPDA